MWLLCCSYNPNKILSDKNLDGQSKNMTMSSYWVISTLNHKKKTSNFLNSCHLKNIVKQKTYFKNPDRPTCIDLNLTNSSRSF